MRLETARKIEEPIEKTISDKISSYAPEGRLKPFHARLMGEGNIRAFELVHSLNTTLGTSIYEQVATLVAKENFAQVERGKSPGMRVSAEAQKVITEIEGSLREKGVTACHRVELNKIRKVCRKGKTVTLKAAANADIFLTDNDNTVYLIDVKTAKPNKAGFQKCKQTILEWMAMILYKQPTTELKCIVAIPYNPWGEQPYAHWPAGNILEKGEQILIGREFWNFLGGGKEVYEELLGCFERAGEKIRPRMSEFLQDRLGREA